MRKITLFFFFAFFSAYALMAQPFVPSSHEMAGHQPAWDDVSLQVQEYHLPSGFSWWCSFIDLSNEGLSLLENALGDNALLIKSASKFITYNASSNSWIGDFDDLTNGRMYALQIMNDNTVCELEGQAVTLEETPIEYTNGWNWIGFPSQNAIPLEDALAHYNASHGDLFKSPAGYSTYSSATHKWTGTLEHLVPGQGYMLQSNTNASGSFHFGQGSKEVVLTDTPSTAWHSNPNAFAFNMSMLADIQLQGVPVRSVDFELGAFCGDECRGATRLQYVEETDSYLAFLTIAGRGNENISFRLLDHATGTIYTEENNYRVAYNDNEILGALDTPCHLAFKNTLSCEETIAEMLEMYPNPLTRHGSLHFNIPENMADNTSMKIQIVDMLGQIIKEEPLIGNTGTINGSLNPGMYLVKAFANDALILTKKLIVK